MNSPSAMCEVERVDRRRVACPGRCASPARSGRQPSLDLHPSRSTAPPSSRRRRSLRLARRRRARRARAAPRRRSAASASTRTVDRRADLAQAAVDRADQPLVRRLEQPAAEQHLDRLVGRARAASSATRASATTSAASRSTISRRDRVVGSASAKHDRRELDHARAAAIRPRWIASASSGGVVEAEVRRHRAARASSSGRGRPRCAPRPTRRRARRRSRRPSRR